MITGSQINEIKDKVRPISTDMVQLTNDIGNEELNQTAVDVAEHIMDPYLFVIVGEVKAGKSSFINALLETKEEICKVAASPMTDTIQEITYGTEPHEVVINDYLKRIYQPVDILKEISIVDTPGTNTIIDHHQEITERFVPAADLIVFVFESKNPYRESAWQFFDYINAEWWKKVIFVLQQKDLMEPEDLAININGVREHAIRKGINSPQVYAVSAKMELNDQIEESGFLPLRKYIDDEILKGKAPILKQENNLSTLLNIHQKIDVGLEVRRLQYHADQAFRDDIKNTLKEQEQKSNLIAEYDRVTQPRVDEIKSGLGFFSMISRSVTSAFGMNENPKEWLTNVLSKLEGDLNQRLKTKLNDGVIDIADSIQQMGKIVDLKLRNSETILKNDHAIFSDIAERRSNVLKELQQSFTSFLSNTENFYDQELAKSSESISPNLAAAGGITAVGVILAAVTNGMVFDITGGVLTTIGLLFAGVSLGFKRRQILQDFTKEIDNGRQRLHNDVSESLTSYISRIKDRIDQNFERFDKHLSREKEDIGNYTTRLSSIKNRITVMQQQLSHMLR
jgi:predicted GTPase